MKGTVISLSILLVCVVHGSAFAQSNQKQSQVKLQQTSVQRLHTKIAQQQSEIAELKRQLAERDTELHSLLKLISRPSNEPGQTDAQPSPNSSNKNDDDDDDSDDSCSGPLYARGGGVRHNRVKILRHRDYLRLNSHSQDKVTAGVPEM